MKILCNYDNKLNLLQTPARTICDEYKIFRTVRVIITWIKENLF